MTHTRYDLLVYEQKGNYTKIKSSRKFLDITPMKQVVGKNREFRNNYQTVVIQHILVHME
jgi:hypothetical protein